MPPVPVICGKNECAQRDQREPEQPGGRWPQICPVSAELAFSTSRLDWSDLGPSASALANPWLITVVPFIFCSDNGNRGHFAVIVLHTFTYKCASTAVGHTYKRYTQNIFMLSKHKRRILQIHIAENTVSTHIYTLIYRYLPWNCKKDKDPDLVHFMGQ